MSLKSFNPRSSDLVCWEWTLTKVRKSHIGKGRFLLHGSAIPVAFHPRPPPPLPSLPRPSFFSPLGCCHRSFGLSFRFPFLSPPSVSPSVFLFGLSPSVFPFVLPLRSPLRSSPSFSPSVSSASAAVPPVGETRPGLSPSLPCPFMPWVCCDTLLLLLLFGHLSGFSAFLFN